MMNLNMTSSSSLRASIRRLNEPLEQLRIHGRNDETIKRTKVEASRYKSKRRGQEGCQDMRRKKKARQKRVRKRKKGQKSMGRSRWKREQGEGEGEGNEGSSRRRRRTGSATKNRTVN